MAIAEQDDCACVQTTASPAGLKGPQNAMVQDMTNYMACTSFAMMIWVSAILLLHLQSRFLSCWEADKISKIDDRRRISRLFELWLDESGSQRYPISRQPKRVHGYPRIRSFCSVSTPGLGVYPGWDGCMCLYRGRDLARVQREWFLDHLEAELQDIFLIFLFENYMIAAVENLRIKYYVVDRR